MAGIAGVTQSGQHTLVTRMLDKLQHRGKTASKLIGAQASTLGAIWNEAENAPTPPILRKQAVWDGSRPSLPEPAALQQSWEPFALAADTPQGIFLARDPLGIRPLYYGVIDGDTLCFASEVKALLEATSDIHEFPPGSWYSNQAGFENYFHLDAIHDPTQPAPIVNSEQAAYDLRLRLEQSISRSVPEKDVGCWLSGGLDSSVITALVRPHLEELHTFAGGLDQSPDVVYARQVADYLNTQHHEIIVDLATLLRALPDVIYYLESFDALLVRSSIVNYLVAEEAASYVNTVYSGEGGDEFFAGYKYPKDITAQELPNELIDITNRLHNTALQRVDRSANAHGLSVHVPLLDPQVVEYALAIPADFKMHGNSQPIEKWILRLAMEDALPEQVLWRPKAKFWQGAGVQDLLSQHAEQVISDAEFANERQLPNGWLLSSKEELMYYRIFSEHFGKSEQLSWMGRTKAVAAP